jgi:hypothetical protein
VTALVKGRHIGLAPTKMAENRIKPETMAFPAPRDTGGADSDGNASFEGFTRPDTLSFLDLAIDYKS